MEDNHKNLISVRIINLVLLVVQRYKIFFSLIQFNLLDQILLSNDGQTCPSTSIVESLRKMKFEVNGSTYSKVALKLLSHPKNNLTLKKDTPLGELEMFKAMQQLVLSVCSKSIQFLILIGTLPLTVQQLYYLLNVIALQWSPGSTSLSI